MPGNGHQRGFINLAMGLGLAMAAAIALTAILLTGRWGNSASAHDNESPYTYQCDGAGNVTGTFSFSPSPSTVGFSVYLTYHVAGSAVFVPVPGASESFAAGSTSAVSFSLSTAGLPGDANTMRIESSLTTAKSVSFLCNGGGGNATATATAHATETAAPECVTGDGETHDSVLSWNNGGAPTCTPVATGTAEAATSTPTCVSGDEDEGDTHDSVLSWNGGDEGEGNECTPVATATGTVEAATSTPMPTGTCVSGDDENNEGDSHDSMPAWNGGDEGEGNECTPVPTETASAGFGYSFHCDSEGNVVGMFTFSPSPSTVAFTVFLTYHVPGSGVFLPVPGGSASFAVGSTSPVSFTLSTAGLPAEANTMRIESSLTNEKSDSFLCNEGATATATVAAATSTPMPTETEEAATATATNTMEAATSTATAMATETATAEATETEVGVATSTATASPMATETAGAGETSTATATATGVVSVNTATPTGVVSPNTATPTTIVSTETPGAGAAGVASTPTAPSGTTSGVLGAAAAPATGAAALPNAGVGDAGGGHSAVATLIDVLAAAAVLSLIAGVTFRQRQRRR